MNFYKGIFGRWVSGFGLLMALSGSVLAQGPWEFNGDTSGWTANNATFVAHDDYTAKMSFSGSNQNNNRIRIIPSGGFDTTGDSILAITLKNETANAGVIVALTKQASANSGWDYAVRLAVPTEATTFSTVYYDLSARDIWSNNATIGQMFLRFKTSSGTGSGANKGDVYIDRIQLLSAIPSATDAPSVAITSSTAGVTNGSTTADSSIGLVFTLSEDTTSFDSSDVTSTGGNLTGFSGSGITYTATFTPTDAGVGTTINVAANAFTGTTSTAANTAASEFSWTLTGGDSTPPVISLSGDQVVEVALDDPYSDAGATASDDTDGPISIGASETTNNVNTSIAGTYTVTYNVSDAAGNSATPVIRTVIVDPWNFNDSKRGWVTNNDAASSAGDTAVTITTGDSIIQGGNVKDYPNFQLVSDANIDPTAGQYLAVTLKNSGPNTKFAMGAFTGDTSPNGSGFSAYLTGQDASQTEFQTIYFDMNTSDAASNWSTATVTGLQMRIQRGNGCLLYTSPSPRDLSTSRMPSSA